MRDKELKAYLKSTLNQAVSPVRMEETVMRCREIMRGQSGDQKEERMGFWRFLSDVFRFEGLAIFGLQTFVLFLVCMLMGAMDEVWRFLPAFMPLFSLAVIPVLFRSRFYKMSELEAATRASGAEMILAKLILVGAANLVCVTVLLFLGVRYANSRENMVQMILYCLTPYLICMTVILRLVRLRKREAVSCGAVVTGASCVLWWLSVKAIPALYEASAMGVWLLGFAAFAVFFGREIYFIVETRKEGRQYGIVL